MKLIVVALLAFAGTSYADVLHNSYGYLVKYGIPEAQRLQKVEEAYVKSQESRIVGGVPAGLGQYPFQAGLLIDIAGSSNRAVCGAVLISEQRLLTAAHCWNDGQHQAWRFTVVLGSVTLFFGGTRVETSSVITHSLWIPLLARNDIAAIYLPASVISANIAPIALPSGSELQETFAGERAIASGFGWTTDDGSITPDQFLSHVNLQVISNNVCSVSFPFIIQPTHVCTSGIGGASVCRGDSGGPLSVTRDGRQVLIGITSFVHTLGCQSGMSAAYTRVTAFMDFIGLHI